MTLTDRSAADEALRECHNCGAWVRRDRTYCPWCGAEQEGGDLTQEPGAHDDDPLLPLFLLEEQEPVAPELVNEPEPEGRSPRFWIGTFIVSAAVLALALLAFGVAGVYQGLRDRDVLARQEAIAYFDQGQQLMQQGRYELAAAAFREAVRLEPEFEAARQGLNAAEAALAGTPVLQAIATPTPSPQQTEQLWQQAQEAIAAERWEEAAVALEQLRSLDPTFGDGGLERQLFEIHMLAGRSARDEGDFATAARHFDQALALRPDAEDALRERQLAGGYRSGLEAWEQQDWERATQEFGRVYSIDPGYFDVAERLATSHLRYADAFWERSIWCEAAQHYQAVLDLRQDDRAVDRLPVARQRCQERAAATPIPPMGEAEEEEVEPGEEIPPPVETVPASTSRYVLDGDIGEDFGTTCTGHSIRGTVRDPDGAPISGVTVRAVDAWGNVYTGVSKENPPGAYDLPISSAVTSYQVMIVEGEVPVSAIMEVRHTEEFSAASAACHILNWLYLR